MEQVDNRIGALPYHSHYRVVVRSGLLLGFALGGFFDGILLHQILQWHHLLSALERAPFGDPRVQILADGLFHAAMYVIAIIGMIHLFRTRYALIDRAATRALGAGVLLGFGGWHFVDAVLSHWLLGIHHIRMDVANPVLWDVLWLGIFGLIPAVGAIALLRRSPPPPGGHDRRSKSQSTLASWLAVAVMAAGLASAVPPAAQSGVTTVTILLRPGATPARLLAGAAASDARVLWSSRRGDVWVLAVPHAYNTLGFYRHGALYVSGALMPAGCASWFRI